LRYGIPQEVLVDVAGKERLDLIAMGKLGRRGLSECS